MGLFFLAKLVPVVQLAFFLNVAASLIASSLLGELKQFIKANPSKKAAQNESLILTEPKSDTDSDDSSDSESVRIIIY